jgi:hypothetical protein
VISYIKNLFGSPHTKETSAISAIWPFDQPQNCAAITMRQVIDREEPILLISHDADDHGWQFIGSSDACAADGKIVCLKHIVDLDPTVLEVADLPPGWQALRDDISSPWIRRVRPKDPDEEA